MPADAPQILALDFDGIICDGLLEYFQTSWGTYCQIWNSNNQMPSDSLASSFYRLRPVIETGWEMPVLVRALILGIPEEKIIEDWATIAQEIVDSEKLNAAESGKKLDAFRDNWIKTDLDSWLKLHRFYPGVIERLGKILSDQSIQLFIVTTKEGRFVKQLLQQQGITLPEERIIGKECKRPKYQTLRILLEAHNCEAVGLWFVEDRLKTLQLVQQQPDLKDVRLFLGDWGYNTKAHHETVRRDSRIELLSLDKFSQDFSAWSI
ncbi:MAG: HAD hydrolase-like protein [Symploca sp. SIO3C6]|uniref:HAD hydrolase-like protein n=1 Tax=Symploca sp. SIO1C4 TaxID=2607765 RepID=A0A6B3NLI7_9CYAN|nr:HAD hydrolase-like protein [Symploca sp. SIO3C6]NER31302.1 HAD hydrolase-like protein [Symploca sp. SIO1C4]NET03216.1 HAD hydrolase-like protein [Symploca sp. SIO2B6]